MSYGVSVIDEVWAPKLRAICNFNCWWLLLNSLSIDLLIVILVFLSKSIWSNVRSTSINSVDSLSSSLILFLFSSSILSSFNLLTLSTLILISCSFHLPQSLIFAYYFSSRKNLVSLSHIFLISSLPLSLASCGDFPRALYFFGEKMSRSYVVE